MTDLKLIITEGEPSSDDKQVLIDGMLAYHQNQGHPRDKKYLSILIRDMENKIMGGVVVCFEWNGMEILLLWVNESIRHQGWGKKLVESVEKEAIKRGATISYTNTFEWQAPEFYKKLGYTLFGKLEGFPTGRSISYLSKNLS